MNVTSRFFVGKNIRASIFLFIPHSLQKEKTIGFVTFHHDMITAMINSTGKKPGLELLITR